MQQHLCPVPAVSLEQLKEWLGVMYLVFPWDFSTLQSLSFFSPPSEYVKALNVFKLYCDKFSWTHFLSGKNKVSRTGYRCHHLARGDYVPSKPTLRCYEALSD